MKVTLFFALLALLISPALSFAGPKIVFDSEVHQFEEVESGTKIPAEFTFRNDGDEKLIISEVKVTCDCTEAFADPATLKPGEEGAIFVTLNTAYRIGNLDKEIIVRTNDPKQGEITLHIKGKTFLPLTFKPSPLFFDNLAPGKDAVADVTLMNTGKGPVTIKKIVKDEGKRMKDEGERMKDEKNEDELQFSISGKGDAPISFPHKLEVGEYIWIRIKFKAVTSRGGSVTRQLAVIAHPAPVTPLILKIQGNLPPLLETKP